MKVKFWLRGPADDPQVEMVAEHNGAWRSDHFGRCRQRSVLRELLTEDEARRLEVADGVWYLPGRPP